ncbi:hypothetical protein J8F10_21285 [Gemmata sp. G18]|uniref:DNA-binding protein n=1 Tax=Gemmata palustris TaxID=2822762 RepID=A0ABS5BVR5_9BACT|nr:hypothetical protein [Gemmata palustris]MBP3957794.1 hypothetical protein [Gemmata palustris]
MRSVHKSQPSHKRKEPGEDPAAKPEIDDGQIDWREQTFNGGLTGPVEKVSTPLELITQLRMVMVDIDPKYLNPMLFASGKGSHASRLYHKTVSLWLDRHPLGKKAEVRHTGSGLHALFHLEPIVVFGNTADRDRWAVVVRAVQNALPSDPNAPGLTALTRPIGSTNSKNDRKVKQLRAGEPITPEEVLRFVDELRRRPFATVAGILHGADRITPCPVCKADGSTLAARDRVGRCYDCGTVELVQLFGPLMSPPSTEGEE